MTQTLEFYTARAMEAAAAAEAATLENVRDRARRSEAAWRGMAHRLELVEKQRTVADQARRERLAAEAAAVAQAAAPAEVTAEA